MVIEKMVTATERRIKMTKEYDQWGYEIKQPNIGKLLSKVVHDWEKERNSFDKKFWKKATSGQAGMFLIKLNINQIREINKGIKKKYWSKLYNEVENQYTEDCIKLEEAEKIEKHNAMKRKGFFKYG